MAIGTHTRRRSQNGKPMLIISMDANEALDRIEPNFLFQMLEAMGFEEKLIQYAKTIFNASKANILTNYVLSNTFPLSRGCWQSCPISPLLFALPIKPLAIAIQSYPSIVEIKFGTSEHKVSLYVDDLLLDITDPHTSVPPLLQFLKEHSAVTLKLQNYIIYEFKSLFEELSKAMIHFLWQKKTPQNAYLYKLHTQREGLITKL